MLFAVMLPALTAIFLVVLVFQKCLDYLLDHKQLRRYPALGPFCGLTNLAYILHISSSGLFRTRILYEEHKAEPIIRLGPYRLSFRDSSAIKDIYGHRTLCLKGDVYATTAGSHTNILNSINNEEHGMKRKRLAAAFAIKNLENAWEFKVVEKIQRLVARFDRYAQVDSNTSATSSQPIDFRKWSNLFTIEAIVDIVLSKDLGFLESGNDVVQSEAVNGKQTFVPFIQSLHGNNRGLEPIVWSQAAYPILRKLSNLLPFFRQQWQNIEDWDGIVRLFIKERRQRKNEVLNDFFKTLDIGIEEGELCAEISILCECYAHDQIKIATNPMAVDAGSDTTAIALTHVLYQLILHPETLQKLRKELADVTDGSDVPSFSSLKQCEYLRACLDESLRLLPPISNGLQRRTPAGGMHIAGNNIAGDVMVSVSAYVAHRNPMIYPEPEEYLPERWVGDSGKELQKHFIAFSTGSRGCIGRNITYLEQTMLIATLVMRYDFSLTSTNWHMEWEERFNLWPKSLPVYIKSRTNVCAS